MLKKCWCQNLSNAKDIREGAGVGGVGQSLEGGTYKKALLGVALVKAL